MHAEREYYKKEIEQHKGQIELKDLRIHEIKTQEKEYYNQEILNLQTLI